MPVNTPTWDQLLAALAKLVPLNDPRAVVFQTAASDRRAQHKLYTLGLQHVTNAGGIRAAAKQSGWCHLAATPELAVAAHGPDAQTITSLTVGPAVHSAAIALPSLRDWQKNHDGYEIVTLRIPGARVEAFWMQYSKPENQDYIWPFLTSYRPLNAKRVWELPKFLEQVKKAVQKDIKFYQNDVPGLPPLPAY